MESGGKLGRGWHGTGMIHRGRNLWRRTECETGVDWGLHCIREIIGGVSQFGTGTGGRRRLWGRVAEYDRIHNGTRGGRIGPHPRVVGMSSLIGTCQFESKFVILWTCQLRRIVHVVSLRVA